KHRELLNPKVREAFAHAINRQQIADTVFLGHAKPWASIISPLSGDWVNPNVRPESYDLKLANRILDGLGYRRGSDGVRRVNCNPTYDQLYKQQGATVDQAKRRQIVWRMQRIIGNQRPYIMLVNLEVVQAYGKRWGGFVPFLDGYSKVLWTDPHQLS